MIPGQCRHGKWATGSEPAPKGDPLKQWKGTTNKETMEQILLHNNSNIELSVERSHWLKKMLMESVNNALGLFGEASKQKVEYDHWIDNAVMLALFKEVFDNHMMVKAVKISLRPFKKSPPDPHVVTSTAYLRLHITGHVKEWTIDNMEDLREMSHNQIHADYEVEHWLITVYGQDIGTVPAPSTPSSRPRSIPQQPEYLHDEMMQLYFLKYENDLKILKNKSQSKMDHMKNLNLMAEKTWLQSDPTTT